MRVIFPVDAMAASAAAAGVSAKREWRSHEVTRVSLGVGAGQKHLSDEMYEMYETYLMRTALDLVYDHMGFVEDHLPKTRRPIPFGVCEEEITRKRTTARTMVPFQVGVLRTNTMDGVNVEARRHSLYLHDDAWQTRRTDTEWLGPDDARDVNERIAHPLVSIEPYTIDMETPMRAWNVFKCTECRPRIDKHDKWSVFEVLVFADSPAKVLLQCTCPARHASPPVWEAIEIQGTEFILARTAFGHHGLLKVADTRIGAPSAHNAPILRIFLEQDAFATATGQRYHYPHKVRPAPLPPPIPE